MNWLLIVEFEKEMVYLGAPLSVRDLNGPEKDFGDIFNPSVSFVDSKVDTDHVAPRRRRGDSVRGRRVCAAPRLQLDLPAADSDEARPATLRVGRLELEAGPLCKRRDDGISLTH